MKENSLFDSLLEESQKPQGPVTCLGMTFRSDQARRAHFTKELRKKLKEPEFRKIEGFPIGSDEDILNLSDPPYYTACPNPWIAHFIAEWEAQKPGTVRGPPLSPRAFCGRRERGKERPHLQRAFLSHEGTAQGYHAVHPPLHRIRGISYLMVSVEPG